jgi:hypothetical protein
MDALEQVIEGERALPRHHDLAVDDKRFDFQRAGCLDELGKIARQGAAGFRLQNDISAVAKEKTAEAVPFRLVLPAASGRNPVDRKRLHWSERRTQPASAASAPVLASELRRQFSGTRQRPRSKSKSESERREATTKGSGPLHDLPLNNCLLKAAPSKKFPRCFATDFADVIVV